MKLLVMKFRVNDLDSSYGKQIEFNSGIVNEFFGFENDTESVDFIYKSIDGDVVNDNTLIKANLLKSPARGDYKIYTNNDGSIFLKQFFLNNLNLTLDNINDFFTIKKIGSKKYEFSYIPQNSEIGKFFSSQNLAGQIINISNEEGKKSTIDKPHNRIIFGAPGTGKSHCLNDDAEKYFEYGLDIKEQLIAEIKNRPQDKDKEPWFNHIGIKYASYIYKRCDEETEGNLQLQWGVTQNELWKMKTAARATIDYNHSVFNTSMESVKKYERVTFHPNYSYAQFVGTYKPVQDSADENQIKYEYIPGPFMRIYTAAKQNPSQNFLLLIEEINRANVAAVFGDVFQLLDRDENGNSEYPVAASEDIKKYLAKNGIHEDELKIPSNMYIWATMNSADQGVFPMDTAFKRRWEFEYIGIDENEDKVKGSEIPISATKKVNWNDLRKAINNKLITLGINEDKLLGPFFLSKTVLDSAFDKGMDFVKLFESKVLMYLFEDAAKMKAKQLFNVDEKKFIYSEVCKKFELEGLKVFKLNEEDVVKEHDIAIKKDAPVDGQLF